MDFTDQLHRKTFASRRGVTLVEMLVTVAMLVIIMTVLVQIFQAATGALSAAQAFQQIDDQLRRVDTTIRSDLEGVTARFTPPLDPNDNLGYFEYGENEFADIQGEDSDDYIRFTAKAPEGRPFTGRMWVGVNTTSYNPNVQPVTVTSQYAEIIYFLRNGNLYRRVLLVAPELQSVIAQSYNNQIYLTGPPAGYSGNFQPQLGQNQISVSWQGVNDLSAYPAPSGNNSVNNVQTIVLNTLGSLTNRENRAFVPRFANDFWSLALAPPALGQDGIPDDANSDNIPDYYPSLYYALTQLAGSGGATNQLIFETGWPNVSRPGAAFSTMAFPYIFPGAYSVPQALSSSQYGWIHSPYPEALVVSNATAYASTMFESNPLAYLQSINHNSIDLGDNLPSLTSVSALTNNGTIQASSLGQTWWGFPTWRETLSPSWNDPTIQPSLQVSSGATPFQPNGLSPRLANNTNSSGLFGVADDADLLPPMSVSNSWTSPLPFTTLRPISQPDSDSRGDQSAFMGGAGFGQSALWSASWEDDLIMANVRSFDVKAYDNALATYADLGWGDDFRLPQQSTYPTGVAHYTNATVAGAPYLAGNYDEVTQSYSAPAFKYSNGQLWGLLTQTFAHEGRIPPIINDNILDAQYPNPNYVNAASFTPQYANINDGADTFTFNTYSSNVGDNNPGVVRLRRVWDSWSTEYTKAPANGVYNNVGNAADPLNFSPWGPSGGTPPIYPSYPPPYPAPLRGIQIQIRVTDPGNRRVKQITIRQDFTDKL